MANVIDSLNLNDNKYYITLPYGTCSTAAATAAKTVTVNNFALDTSARIVVKFTVTNTASSPTLNVNGTGAKAIYYRGSAISASYLAANHTYEFIYNGTQWELIGNINTNTDTKVTQTATTSDASYPLLLAPSGQTATTTTTSYFDSGVTLNPSTNTIVANVSGNAATATKLATARTITLGTGATGTATSFNGSANITIPVTRVKEAYLSWGGKDISGGFSALDAALIDDLSANRLAGHSSSKITFERSSDGGLTWATYNGNADLVTTSGIASNANTTTSQSVDNWHRITINVSGIYCELRKIALWLSTNGATGSQCKVEWGDYSSTTVWTTVKTVPVSGWAGWNIINVSQTIGSPSYGNTKYVRLTFSQTGINSNYNSDLRVAKIRFYSNNCWEAPSNLAENGHVYSYDASQNVTFPASVRATSFNEDGTTLSSKYSAKSHKHSVTAVGTNSSTSITPAGTVSQPTFTGTSASHNHTFTGTAASHNHTFTGTKETITSSYLPSGTVSSTFTGTAHNHTFTGSTVTSGAPDETNVTTIYSITGVGSLPSASLSSGTLPSHSYTAPSHSYTAPSLSASVSNQCLTLTWSAGSHSFSAGSHSFSAGSYPTLTFSAGSLPTRSSVSMPNTSHTHSVTASGSIGNTTATGSVSSTFTGIAGAASATYTPAGSISSTSVTPAGTIANTSITPAGTVSQPTFTGTAASHTHTFTGSAVISAAES